MCIEVHFGHNSSIISEIGGIECLCEKCSDRWESCVFTAVRGVCRVMRSAILIRADVL